MQGVDFLPRRIGVDGNEPLIPPTMEWNRVRDNERSQAVCLSLPQEPQYLLHCGAGQPAVLPQFQAHADNLDALRECRRLKTTPNSNSWEHWSAQTSLAQEGFLTFPCSLANEPLLGRLTAPPPATP